MTSLIYLQLLRNIWELPNVDNISLFNKYEWRSYWTILSNTIITNSSLLPWWYLQESDLLGNQRQMSGPIYLIKPLHFFLTAIGHLIAVQTKTKLMWLHEKVITVILKSTLNAVVHFITAMISTIYSVLREGLDFEIYFSVIKYFTKWKNNSVNK